MATYKGTELRNDLKEMVEQSPMDTIQFAGDTVLPGITVNDEAGKVPTQATSAGMKELDLKRAKRSSFKRGEWVWGNDSYATYEYGYEEPVDNVEKLSNADIFDEEVVSGNIARNQLLLAREKRVADAVFNATTFTAAADHFDVVEEWDDATNATPYADITATHALLKAKAGIPRSACHLLINEVVFRNVMRSVEVRADVKYTRDIGSAPEAEKAAYLAAYLGIAKVNIATSFYDTTDLGIEDAVFADLWSNEYGMLYLPCPSVNSWKVKGLGRQPVWGKFSPDYRVESYPESQTDATIVRVREYRGEWINTKFGVLMLNMTT